MIAGKKTEAGRDRRIPLHKAILPLIEKRMREDGEILITREKNGERVPMTYRHFISTQWEMLMQDLKMDYTPHYCRHTCATLMREAGIEEDIRKIILGHKSTDITDRYTHYSDEMLIEAIDKLEGR
jgi:integrase